MRELGKPAPKASLLGAQGTSFLEVSVLDLNCRHVDGPLIVIVTTVAAAETIRSVRKYEPP
jgi:hypothetical protein